MLDEWVSQAIEKAELSYAEIGRRMTDRLGRNIDRAAVQKMAIGKRGIDAAEALALAEITGHPLPGYEVRRIPLVSWVSAGKLEEDMTGNDVEQWLPIAGLGRGDYFATVVRGSSMDRISPEGSIIVVDRSVTTLQNNKPYLFSVRGEATYKLWNERLEALMPFSTMPHDPIPVDVDGLLVVGRVRRSMLDL
jgi:SOS-response transcriptional repressor LexA